MDQGCGRHIFTNKIYNKGYEHLLPNSHATRLICVCVLSRSVVSDSFQSYKLYVACQSLSMGFPSKNIGVGCHSFLQGIFPTQESNLCLLQWQADSSPLSHLGSPKFI